MIPTWTNYKRPAREPDPTPRAEKVASVIAERLKQHRDNLHLWQSGFLAPTEPDEDERAAVMRELRAAIFELEHLVERLGLDLEQKGGHG